MKEVEKKYSERNLRNMRRFYILFKNENWNAVRSNLSWTHYRTILSLSDFNEILYYINIASKENIGYRELAKRIKKKEYEKNNVYFYRSAADRYSQHDGMR